MRKQEYGAERHRNPEIGNTQFYWGCRLPDHMLNERKCTDTLDSIETRIADSFGCDTQQEKELNEKCHTLHVQLPA